MMMMMSLLCPVYGIMFDFLDIPKSLGIPVGDSSVTTGPPYVGESPEDTPVTEDDNTFPLDGSSLLQRRSAPSLDRVIFSPLDMPPNLEIAPRQDPIPRAVQPVEVNDFVGSDDGPTEDPLSSASAAVADAFKDVSVSSGIVLPRASKQLMDRLPTIHAPPFDLRTERNSATERNPAVPYAFCDPLSREGCPLR